MMLMFSFIGITASRLVTHKPIMSRIHGCSCAINLYLFQERDLTKITKIIT
jgi:hypothetical protein